ncbi:MAG: hypothetical protein ACRD4V_01645 [Candidatus Acidiferrales bacterium]
MQAPPDNLTRFLAAWGAVLATFGLGWTLYRDLLDRAKLQISAKVRRIALGPDGKYFAVAPNLPVRATEKLFVVMTVVNVGRRPVMWQGWGGKYHKREPEGSAFFIVGQNLPKMLQEGESHAEMTELEDNLKPASDNVKKLYVWDPAGKEWALSRKELKKLRKDARDAKELGKR